MRFQKCLSGIVFLILCIFVEINSFPTDTTPTSLVVAAPEKAETTPSTDVAVQKPVIKSMLVESNVSSRYAKTLVTSRVNNPSGKANEVTFSIVIPETAFITGFSMEIEGKVYEAYVKEKNEAKKVYDTAVSSGQAAGHVAVQTRDSNHFTVSVNLEPKSKAIFRLRYEELLVRRLGLYNLVINLNPGQVVDNLSVDVNIKENSPIKKLLVPELRTGNEIDADPSDPSNPFAHKMLTNDNLIATVHFSPNREQQLELMKIFKEKANEMSTPSPYGYSSYVTRPDKEKPDEGVSGQFVVQYDVDRDVNGEILVNDGYFVHFFAPENLKPLSKHVIFVLDVSGSMSGRKIDQLREAMISILQDLNPGDYFNIMDFSYGAKVYNLDDPTKHAIYKTAGFGYYGEPKQVEVEPEVPPNPKLATPGNIEKAKNIIKGLQADGGTNIYDALLTALKIANYGIQAQNSTDLTTGPNKGLRVEPMIVFLTDGEPTVGTTNVNTIIKDVTEKNIKKTAIFSLAFGEDADRNFLRKISLKNYGFMRHIYEAADAALQLKHFYRQISSPLLANVKYIYPTDQIDALSTTRTQFDLFFLGSELITAGKLLSNNLDTMKITADCYDGPIDFIPIVPKPDKKKKFWPLERLWAYLTIKQLLDENEAGAEIKNNATDPTKKALELALKYSFVTPLTSLVVVKPNSSSAVNAESLQTTPPPYSGFSAIALSAPRPIGGFGLLGPSGAPGAPGAPVYAPASGFSHSSSYSYKSSISSYPLRSYMDAVGVVPLSLRLASSQIVAPRFPTLYLTTTRPPHINMLYDLRLPFNEEMKKVDETGMRFGSRPIRKKLIQSSQDSFDFQEESEVDLRGDLASDFDSDIPTTNLVAAPTVSPPVISRLAPYNLQAYSWLEQYLTDKDNTISLPSTNGTTTYKLKLNQDPKDDNNPSCPNSIDGGSGICKYLTECDRYDDALKDLTTYMKYNCDVNGYAGICCKS